MAKIVKVSGFDLSSITAAFLSADAHATAFDAMTAEMVAWHAAGVYPVAGEIVAALVAAGRKPATGAVYASNMLAWAKSGTLPKTLSQMVKGKPVGHVKKVSGAPTKKTAKAAPMVAASAGPAAGSEVSPMHRWNIVLNDMVAQALIVRDAKNQVMGVEDAKEVQAALMSVKAILGKYL